VRLDAAVEEAILSVAQSHPATPFNLNYADADGQALALRIRELLLRGGWSPLSPASPAPGFQRRGVIVWAPREKVRVAEALAGALQPELPVQVVERNDGGPVALTVGVATWSATRAVQPQRG
jgi:hypothetical protein